MKKLLFVFLVGAFAACGGNSETPAVDSANAMIDSAASDATAVVDSAAAAATATVDSAAAAATATIDSVAKH